MSTQNQHIKIIKFKNYEEHHLTVRGNVCNENNLKKYLKNLEKRGLRILRMVVFGKISIIKKINKSVETYPYIILGHSNNSKNAAEKCGIEIVAAKGEFDDFEYIEFGQKVVGVYFKVSDREYLYVSGLGMAKTLRKIGFREEVRKTYELIDSINARYKFSAQNIYRFWNCMENILGNNAENYAFFNRERDAYFKKHGILDYPAATGIESKLPEAQNFNLSLEAVKVGDVKDIHSETLHSDFQCEAWEYKKYRAWEYGPKFSRAKLLDFKNENIKKAYISGTSNVDRKGSAVFLDDKEKNIKYVMICVEHLLKKAGLSLDDILSSRVYFKNLEMHTIFKKIYREKKWNFPFNPLFADICRNNFFFEMECVAAKKFDNTERIRKKSSRDDITSGSFK